MAPEGARMAPIDRRLRVWAWMVRRQTAALTRSEADVIALQSRHAPANAVTNYITNAIREVLKQGKVPHPDRMFTGTSTLAWDRLALDFDGNKFIKNNGCTNPLKIDP